MLQELQDKIKAFDVSWEVDSSHILLQKEMDSNMTFRVYREERDKGDNHRINDDQIYSLEAIQDMTKEELISKVFILDSSSTSLTNINISETSFYQFKHQKFTNDNIEYSVV